MLIRKGFTFFKSAERALNSYFKNSKVKHKKKP
jgi:hypothetical protein